jgi:hypothetical protein
LAFNYINILEDYKAKYEKELKESSYIATKEFIFPEFFNKATQLLYNEFYLAIFNNISFCTYKKCKETFLSCF